MPSSILERMLLWPVRVKLVQVWVVCFAVFFGVAELYQWVQGFTLPIPVLVCMGALLAIASNADKFPRKRTPPPPSSTPSRSYAGFPLLQTTPKSQQPISFTIHKPEQPPQTEKE